MKIAIDCGHNCNGDTGASGNGVLEDRVTWRIGHKLANAFSKDRMDARIVNPTRETSTVSQSLARRVANANNIPAQVYISIHCNAAGSASAKGTEVFYFGNNETGKAIATLISRDIAKAYGTTNRGAKSNSTFYVLRNTNMTAVLVELGFLTNKSDAADINNEANDAAVVDAIKSAVYRVLVNYVMDVEDATVATRHASPEHVPFEAAYVQSPDTLLDVEYHPNYVELFGELPATVDEEVAIGDEA